MRQPVTIAHVQRRNGAYLITLAHHTLTVDLTTDELVNAASSLMVAKRIARQMADDIGVVGPFRWEDEYNGRWFKLNGYYEDEPDDG